MLVVASTPTSGPITARQEELLTSSHFNWPPASNSELANSRLLVYRNKLPKFNETMKTFCLNFHGRVTMPSVKNFQLALADEVDEPGSKGTGGMVRLQFGRVGRDTFSIDVHDPMMVMMGWAVALTTFDAIEKV
ncbi:tubby C-terminal-like domain-containing protein [Catenaria anguillulae PL171]|uniref:Tubby C-terminal-like domain-containing protein n=1 Tax=Catenaria anguillulae PL171 TaxID=765915 RepID=A0A1Y2I1X2_9FUNG|nr:tubby C-terminal-like domain-containing protein [Catenaria anguillulae PL171]